MPTRLAGRRSGLLMTPFSPRRLPGLVGWWDSALSPKTLRTTSHVGSGTVTQSGTTLTGTLSAFLSEVVVGDVITADAGSPLISGTVTAIASNTSLTLSTSATQAVGQTYTVAPVAGTSDRVSQWDDLSGFGGHVSKAGVTAQPALVPGGAGGMPYLLFDGVNDGLQATDGDQLKITGALTLFAVYRFVALANFAAILNKGDGTTAAGSAYEIVLDNSVPQVINADTFIGAVKTSAAGASPTAGTDYMAMMTRTAAGAITLYVNGASVGTASDGGAALNNPTNPVGFGQAGDGTPLEANLRLYAVAIVNRLLSDRERWQTERYYSRRTGIAVS